MSKAVKELLMRDYRSLFEGVEGALVVSLRGIDANENNRLRNSLREKGVRVTVVRNTLARKVFEGGPLEGLAPVLEGPSALAYGAESVVDVARELVKWAKEVKQLELKGAILDGELYEGPQGVEALSKLPTREEAIAQVVTLLLSPARTLAGQALGPGARLAGAIKTIAEKLEQGETIEKVA